MPLTLRAYAVLSAALLLVSVACGGARKDTGLPAGPTAEPITTKGAVQVKDNVFDPKETRVKVGEPVTWLFAGSAQPHNVEAEDGSFNSHQGCGPTATDKCSKGTDPDFVFTFRKAGEFPYICAIHGFKGGIGMAGKVIVEA